MNDKQARELAELRAFLTARGLTVLVCQKDGDALHVRVPADQEDRLRGAMADWSRTRMTFWMKRPRKPDPPAEDSPPLAAPAPVERHRPGSRHGLKVIDTSGVAMTDELEELAERLAEHGHNRAVRQRLAAGWSYGPEFDPDGMTDPWLVPYADLSDTAKEDDRVGMAGLIKAALALGYRITRG